MIYPPVSTSKDVENTIWSFLERVFQQVAHIYVTLTPEYNTVNP